MDKYEYNLKLDQMKTLYADESYESAAEIADTINWNRIKNVNALVKAGEVYEKAERYTESREVLMMAYDRSPIGRMIIYRLAEVAIKMKDFEGAQEYYDEFVEIAPHDNLKYVLRYHIRKEQGAPYEELIPILEDFKEQEYMEEWAYELAYLYHKSGNSDKCIDACDELILWFGDGPYVERALELKMLYQPLTKTQEEKYRKFRREKAGYTDIDSSEMEQAGEFAHPNVSIPQVVVNPEKFNTVNLQEEIARGMQQIMDATEKETVSDTMDSIKKIVEEIPYLQIPREEAEVEPNQHIETDEEIDGSLKINFQEMLGEESDGQISLVMNEKAMLEKQITGQMTIEEVLNEWEKTKRAAEAALQEAEQRKLESAKARALMEAEDIMDRLNDVIPKLDAGVSPKELLEEEYLQQPIDLEARAAEMQAESVSQAPVDAEEVAQEFAQELQQEEAAEELASISTEQEELPQEEASAGEVNIDNSSINVGMPNIPVPDLGAMAGIVSSAIAAEAPVIPQVSLSPSFTPKTTTGMKELQIKDSSPEQAYEEIPSYTQNAESVSVEPSTEIPGFVEERILAKEIDRELNAAVSNEFTMETADAAFNKDLDKELEKAVEPLEESIAAPVMEPTVEPVAAPVMEPTVEPVAAPVMEPTVEPVAEPVMEPTVEPVAEPVMEPTVEPVAAPVMEPTVEPVAAPVMEPMVESVEEATVAPVMESMVTPVAEATVSLVSEEPVAPTPEEEDLILPEIELIPELMEMEAEEEAKASEDEVAGTEEEAKQEVNLGATMVMPKLPSEALSKPSEPVTGETKRMPSIREIDHERFLKYKTARMPVIPTPEDLNSKEEEVVEKTIESLSQEQKAIFTYFVPVKGMEDQLCKALTGITNHLRKGEPANTGNLIIQGERGCGKTVLATSLIKVVQNECGRPNGKIGKIDATALNEKDPQLLLNKVAGGCLIIEQAGELTRNAAVNLSFLLEHDSSGTLIILEDTSRGIRTALALDENFAKKFTEKIAVPIFTNDELVSFARSYSNELGYEIEEMAVLALYNRISNIQRLDQATTLTEVKDIVDEAIEREARGGLKKAINILTAKRYTEDDKIVLTEKDFEIK